MLRIAKIKGNTGTADKKQEIDGRDIRLPPFFRGIADPQFGPEVEPHALADQGIRPRDQGLAGDDGRCRGDDDDWYQEPRRHDIIKGIAHCRIENPVLVLVQKEGALAEIVQDQTDLDIDPGKTDIVPAAMPEIAV